MSEAMRPPDDELRSRAITILKKRRDFRAHLLIYVLVNGALVTVWAVTNPDVFFWPVFLIIWLVRGRPESNWQSFHGNDGILRVRRAS